MYSSIKIKGFRDIYNIDLQNLGQINIFLGHNNCGKTNVLKAVYALSCGHNFSPFTENNFSPFTENKKRSSFEHHDRIVSLFNNTQDPPYEFTIDANTLAKKDKHKLSASFNPIFNEWTTKINDIPESIDLKYPPEDIPDKNWIKAAIFHDVFAHEGFHELSTFNALSRSILLNDVIKELKIAFPEITDIYLKHYPDGFSKCLFVKTERYTNLPFRDLSDGIQKWFYLVGQIAVFKDACHCISGIDGGMHLSSLVNMLKLLAAYSEKSNSQLFITANSIEFVDAFIKNIYKTRDGIYYGRDNIDHVRVFEIRKSIYEPFHNVYSFSGKSRYREITS